MLSLWSVLPLTAAFAEGDAMIDYASGDAIKSAIASARQLAGVSGKGGASRSVARRMAGEMGASGAGR